MDNKIVVKAVIIHLNIYKRKKNQSHISATMPNVQASCYLRLYVSKWTTIQETSGSTKYRKVL